MEQQLLDKGLATYDWDIGQIREMYKFTNSGNLSVKPGTPKSYDEYGNPEYYVTESDGKLKVNKYSIEGHHMKNVSENPALAGDGRNIQFLSRSGEHIDAHAGNFANETMAFYDGKNYVGVDYISPSVENGGITRKQFLDEYNDPEHYRPELPNSNRSHKGEDLTDNYFGK